LERSGKYLSTSISDGNKRLLFGARQYHADNLITIDDLIDSYRGMALPFQSRLPVLVISLILIELAHAGPISVCSNGNDCSPVQECIDSSFPGDILELHGCNGSDITNSAEEGELGGSHIANYINQGCSAAMRSSNNSTSSGGAIDFAHNRKPDRAVILTAIPVEYEAVLAHLADLHEESIPQGNIYQVGKFSANNHTWEVVVALTGMHNPNAAVATERAIREFNPKIVLFVGTAGGVKDVKIGDVVVAGEVYDYESGAIEASSFSAWPEAFRPTYRILQRAKMAAVERDWLMRLKNPAADAEPAVIISAIASGEKLLASNQSDINQLLASAYGNVGAVDMEGAGFLRAAYVNPGVEALLVRGISDLLYDAQEGLSQDAKLAAEHASAFAFEVLASFEPEQQQQLSCQPKPISKLE
jgi:nucleoside phosphorylase